MVMPSNCKEILLFIMQLTGVVYYTSTGAIVAIQDVDEHMYFAAEGRRGKSCLVGSFHYSLVGKEALFRVCIILLIIIVYGKFI